MRYAMVLAIAALFAPATALAADPPITFQTQPLSRLLDDLRAAADVIGGEKAVKALNASIKDKLGDKGFQGLDLTRHVVGYVILTPKPEDVTAVIAFPIAGEKEFLAFCERWNGGEKAKDLGKGIYEVPPLIPQYKARMRFSEQYAYIAFGAKPEPSLDDKVLVSPNKLIDPADQAIASGKLHFERIPIGVKFAIPKYYEEIKNAVAGGGVNGIFGIGAQELAFLKPLGEEFDKMIGRFIPVVGNGADSAEVRLNLDVPSGDLSFEATLKPKPDRDLAVQIAGFKPTTNNFDGLITPDTVAGFKLRLPLLTEELKNGTAKGLEQLQKLVPAANSEKDLMDELFKGLIRTAKTGEFDIVGGVRGPDKNGEFNLVAAIAFENSVALEKEVLKYSGIKLDAVKAGNVNIYSYKMDAGNAIINYLTVFGGEKCTIAYAFAPKGIFVVIGADPIPTMKEALAVKPAEAPILDVVVNPARMKKFVEKIDANSGLVVERALGTEDKLLSAMSLKISGGKEMTAKATLNLRVIPRAIGRVAEPTDKP